jgi:hypothetical protein
MEPVFDGLVLLRRETPLTRRLLVYFPSGAYTRQRYDEYRKGGSWK